jgi:hypothetical protein
MSLPSSLGAMNEEQFGGLSITKQTVLSLQVKKRLRGSCRRRDREL